ncbi:glutathione S-transferase family protein [Mariprofundus ferrooxydans]|uniref:glutathione S-transferase family protein n=1 Tax=Mariprofundus ferrooxydans TaxID=314344 RepID=UPI00142FCE0D|nr:glutathione S-transferase family protein [Mariprofundus ferrooxydans]
MANIKFYMTPGSCSTGIHILLEELELIFEVHPVNLMAGDQFKPEFLAINPRGSVPVLVTPAGTTLTTYQSISCWLAEQYPQSKLIPEDSNDLARVMGVMNYACNKLHGEGFTRIFTPDRYSIDESEKEAVIAQGHKLIERRFAKMNDLLAEGRTYVLNQFSIADSALFYVEFWADHTGIPLPEHCRTHYERMLKRPAVRQVLMEEGYSRLLSRYSE